MAVITLQLGQCGNQLGERLFESLYAEAKRGREALASSIKSTYFAEQHRGEAAGTWHARSVLVDTEPRVVGACLEGSGRPKGTWKYRSSSTLWQQGGAANNWAYGFNKCGPAMEEKLLECVRREAEACDRVSSFMALHSVAGGTGSGLGSYALQAVHDAYLSTTIVATCVWPFESGEVSVQSYNAALTTAATYEIADMVLLLENERYLEISKLTLREAHPTLGVVNGAICEGLMQALLPCRSPVALGSLQSPLSWLASQLCAHPAYRLATVRALPQVARGAEAFTADSWIALQRRMTQICNAGAIVDRLSGDGGSIGQANPAVSGSQVRYMAAAAFLRGDGAAEVQMQQSLDRLSYWRYSLEPLRVYTDPHAVRGIERSLGVVSVCQTVLPALKAATTRAATMLRSSAYIHQYERYGVGREEMSQALLALLQVEHDYEQL